MKQTFYSHGKLLITAEYIIVDGAQGLALPCKLGQRMEVKVVDTEHDFPIIKWKSYTSDHKVWFQSEFLVQDDFKNGHWVKSLKPNNPSDLQVAIRLAILLNAGLQINKDAFKESVEVETYLEFPQDWGLGSSSTLIADIAQWLEVDPYKLFYKSTKGSGYDVACGLSNQPILFSRNNDIPKIKPIRWKPKFSNQLFFVHLGKKQKSDKEVQSYSSLVFNRDQEVARFSDLTQELLHCNTLIKFEDVLIRHEERLSMILQRPTIKEELFDDYDGVIKSLGAWGGDFVLVTARNGFQEYFLKKGYSTVLSFREMLL